MPAKGSRRVASIKSNALSATLREVGGLLQAGQLVGRQQRHVGVAAALEHHRRTLILNLVPELGEVLAGRGSWWAQSYSLVGEAMYVAGSCRPRSGTAWTSTHPRTNGSSKV